MTTPAIELADVAWATALRLPTRHDRIWTVRHEPHIALHRSAVVSITDGERTLLLADRPGGYVTLAAWPDGAQPHTIRCLPAHPRSLAWSAAAQQLAALDHSATRTADHDELAAHLPRTLIRPVRRSEPAPGRRLATSTLTDGTLLTTATRAPAPGATLTFEDVPLPRAEHVLMRTLGRPTGQHAPLPRTRVANRAARRLIASRPHQLLLDLERDNGTTVLASEPTTAHAAYATVVIGPHTRGGDRSRIATLTVHAGTDLALMLLGEANG
ncbi:hypothetical protein P3T27_008097 [Kitasatospora sp. MAA19]|uniref:hypothetical protein n=1 Tax=unclassified Kitasatospora TaxID=2633591 RepID=UPI0024738C81|nr:hypothetical protein [Kitasatospora sp. MAA19]MDH6711339.1 hypothetical protein [Kitasatospora sp. MAA19]